MATGTGTLRAASGVGANGQIPASQNGGVKTSYIEVFDLAAAAFEGASGDFNLVAQIPQGDAITAIKVRSSVSLTTAQLKFGTLADDDLFGTAKAYGTTANAEVDYLLAAQAGQPLAALTSIYMGITTAALPASGTVVVEVETSTRG